MLCLDIPAMELFNNETNEFIYIDKQHLDLEHSLISISKWEAKWHKPFLNTDKTVPEISDYIKCMTINKNVDSRIYSFMPPNILAIITKYLEDPQTATWFSDDHSKSKNKEVITSELIYYWMISYNIPSEYEKWHINRLLTLIRVCAVKNEPPKKMSQADIRKQNAALNAKRKQQLHTKG